MREQFRNKRCSANGRNSRTKSMSKVQMGFIEFWKGRSEQRNTEKLSEGKSKGKKL
jgi:hypothetical protein